ncbi:MAG: S-adenosyl-l-methionine hydroxide adenosyltransferase family protein [Verrucomicrobia bacterium]|nr:S-adenosyl-l-methionine hydroxide adenosyltransferase family protein [Verrucomicrobiota bacterium]
MKRFLLLACLSLGLSARAADHALVIQTDFGTKDGAVAAMKGVAVGVDPHLPIFDLSQENTPYDIWEAAYRLKQSAPYWPAGTVFVSVIDPGVGTARASVVLQTKNGQFFVGPDNGTWTLVAEELGIAAVRRIDEKTNRRAGSEKSYTFHGRDIYAYTGARLASGTITFEQVGPLLPPAVVSLPYQKPALEKGVLHGTIPMIDFHYGNVWTNIPDTLFNALKPAYGDKFTVVILHNGKEAYRGVIPYVHTFGDVPEGAPLLYLNSLMNVAVALNMGNFSEKYGLASGGDWTTRIERAK